MITLEEFHEREKERNLIIDKDTEFDCVWYVKENYPDTFKEEYPKENEDASDYYIDQSMMNVVIADRRITSTFTPYGISGIDEWFSKQIQKGSKFSKEELEQMIKRNPHLHNIIKTNLLSNLKINKWNGFL